MENNTPRVSGPVGTVPAVFENDMQRCVYNAIANAAIPFKRVVNEPCVSMDDCRVIDEALQSHTVKTIFLTNRQQNRFFLVVMPGDKPFVTKDFSRAMEVPRMSFASAALLGDMLGVEHGAASPMCMVVPGASRVTLCVDKDVTELPVISFPDTTLHGYIAVDTGDFLEKLLPAINVNPAIIVM